MNLPPEALRLPPHLLHGASILSDRSAILPLLPHGLVVAEVGVGLGGFSQYMIDVCRPRLFIGIDDFKLHEIPTFWDMPTSELFEGLTHEGAYRRRFAAAIEAGRMQVIAADSAAGLESLPDASVDVIYLDADHRYDSVARELQVAVRKVTPDGWLILNDYLMVPELHAPESYGVVQAAHEFMVAHDWGMQYLALQTRMFADVVLRPAACLPAHADRAAKLEDDNRRLRAELAALRGSTSWRATAPVRSLVNRLRPPRPRSP